MTARHLAPGQLASDHGSTTSGLPEEPAGAMTVGEAEERSNRTSWRIMYVFIGVIVALFVVMGVIAFAGQSG